MGAIRCATAQFQHRASDKAYNLEVIERFAEEAARGSARIVVFPEMCVTGYWHVRNLDRVAIEALAEAVPDGPSVETLARLARSATASPSALENVCMCALLGADLVIAPHQTGGCASRSPHAMGLIDCDLWRRRDEDPEAIEAEFRGPKGREWLMRWLPSRAHDNGLFILFSNGVGEDDGEVRTGNAMILDPYGHVLAETWRARDELLVTDLDLDLLPVCTGRRWIRGRRPELYGLLTERMGYELGAREARFSGEPTKVRPPAERTRPA